MITIKYFVSGGIVDMPALFTVDTCGETGALGFSIGNFSNISSPFYIAENTKQ
jgi:hypothetical protein